MKCSGGRSPAGVPLQKWLTLVANHHHPFLKTRSVPRRRQQCKAAPFLESHQGTLSQSPLKPPFGQLGPDWVGVAACPADPHGIVPGTD